VLSLHFLDRGWYGAPVKQWLLAAGVLAVTYLALVLLRRVVARRLEILAARTETDWDDLLVEIVRRTRPYFIAAIAIYAATRVIAPPREVSRVLSALAVVVVLLQAGVWGNGIIGFGAEHYIRKRSNTDTGTRTTIRAVGYAARFMLWGLLVVTALQNFGINVTALVTGLGIGGIAIALAVQNILGDLFAALAIVLDKPFVVGDAVQVDNVNGTIEHVGLKTTRIRSVDGEQVIIANADLLRSRIRNHERRLERRVVFHVDVAYDTTPEKLERIPAIVKAVVETHSPVRFGRCHFLTWTESALRFEVVFHVLDAGYERYADIQHAINIELLRRFAAERIQFAFPLPTVIMKREPQPT
jgi:small-conductance mechanosensitive channel